MTIKSILKSKACDGNKNDKKCAKALNKYITKKYKHKTKRTRSVSTTKHSSSTSSAKVINKINFNQPASVSQAGSANASIPQPRATGQGVPADVPYKNLINQKLVYETKLKNAQKENVRLLALSKLNSSSTGSSTMNDASTMTDTGKAGRPPGSKNKPKDVIPMADTVSSGTGETFNEGDKDKDYLEGMSQGRRGDGGLRGFGGGSANASGGGGGAGQDPSTKKPRKKRCPNGERRNSLTGLCEKIL